jgi:hypothetical protein
MLFAGRPIINISNGVKTWCQQNEEQRLMKTSKDEPSTSTKVSDRSSAPINL